MTIDAATLAVKVQANTSQAEQGLGGIFKMLASGPGLAIGVGVAVAGIGLASIKMAGDFQSGMTSLVTGAGESQKNIAMVSQGVLNMATATGTSTSQLTAGMYMIESAGYHGAAGLNILQAAAEGAKVGNADLGTVADATTTIMTDYAGAHISAAMAVNLLTATVASGKTHMEDLAGAMAQILPTASAARVSLGDVMGAMATMTAEGVPAANAATYLRQTILALDAPSKASQKAMEAVGLSSSAVAAEMQKSLPGALQMITQRLAAVYGEGSPQYVAALKEIAGGSKQMQGVLDLTGTHMAAFVGNVAGVTDAAKKGGNQIVGWSEVQKDFNFKMAQAGEVVQVFMIQLGQKLLPVATQVVTLFVNDAVPALTLVMNAIGKVISIGAGLMTFLQGTGPAATVVKIAIAALAGAMSMFAVEAIVDLVRSIIASIPAWIAQAGAIWANAIAALALVAPMLLIGAAIGIVIAIVILAVQHWGQITQALHNFWNMLGQVAGAIGQFVGSVLGWFGNLFGGILGGIGVFIGAFIGAVTGFAGNVVNAIKTLVGDIIGFYIRMYGTILGDLGNFIGGFLGFIGNLHDRVATGFTNLVNGILGIVGGLPGDMLALGVKIIQALAQGITNAAGAVGNAVKNIPVLGGALSGAANLLPHFATGGTMQGDGLAVVGENGPELVRMPGGSQITPIAQGQGGGVSGLPAGMSQVYGAASGTAAGAPIQVNLYLDSRQFAAVIVPLIPSVVHNAVGGSRSF